MKYRLLDLFLGIALGVFMFLTLYLAAIEVAWMARGGK